MPSSQARSRRSLFQKYLLALFVAVAVPLLASELSDAWFGYRDQRALLNSLLQAEAGSAARKIQSFLEEIRDQLGWTVQQAWSAGSDEAHRIDALRLLHQVPAITSLTLVDGTGTERLYVSRTGVSRIGRGVDLSSDPAVSGTRSGRIWYGPVTYQRESEPFMTIGLAGNRESAGLVLAEINLKLIWDVISAIHVGHSGEALVLDQPGRLIAHPDIGKVLRGTGDKDSANFREMRDAIVAAHGQPITSKNADGQTILVAMASIPGVNWSVFVEQPLAEAFAPIYAALWRTIGLLVIGAAFAGALAYGLARRMSGPIRLLEEGTERIGAGKFDHRIEISTGDELERLAAEFNRMAAELGVSQERSERITRLKQFLAPQVAELVEKAGDDQLLAGHRATIVAVFCDLRGFTAFSAHSEPEQIIEVLSEYYKALGAIISRYEATLTSFSGDGLMVLVNAPMPCVDPALRAVRMAIEMQQSVQSLIIDWQSRGYTIGFGIGLAMGPATVGQIGYEGRVDYTAIGNVVNLASRLCSAARDHQILIDPIAAAAIHEHQPLLALGSRPFKGLDEHLPVYAVEVLVSAGA